MEEPRWIALVAKNPADARDYMIEGPGGIMKNTHPSVRPNYEPSKRRLTWENGSWATIYSSVEPDQLRGYSGDTAWLDEFAKWDNPRECWDNLAFGMREASTDRPRLVITTTPRPITLLTQIEARANTVTVRGTSYENRANLDPTWYAEVIEPYEGTTLGRQEIHAEIMEELPDALWKRKQIDALRVKTAPEQLERVVVAIDPATTSGEDADETGIIVAGVDREGEGYVLADLTCRTTPDGWARRAVNAYHDWQADRIIAEQNQGGEMVELTLRTVDRSIPYRGVHASRGKRTRAEPVAALYEQGKVHHVGTHSALEDQQCMFTPDTTESPDRVDALVYALTDLMLKPSGVRIRTLG